MRTQSAPHPDPLPPGEGEESTADRGSGTVAEMFCGILPPYILVSIAQNGTPEERRRALATLIFTERLRGQRRAPAAPPQGTPVGADPPGVSAPAHTARLSPKTGRGAGGAPPEPVALAEA